MPLVDYYRKLGKLIEINGVQPVEQVTKDLLAALKK
jgi:adenylate kinase family enzyme